MSEVGSQFPASERGLVGIAIAGQPVLDIVDPVLPGAQGFLEAMIIDQPILVLFGVEGPRQGELFEVVSAGHSLGFCLGVAEGRQQQRCQQGNDAHTVRHEGRQ